jgi:hypothetical protein
MNPRDDLYTLENISNSCSCRVSKKVFSDFQPLTQIYLEFCYLVHVSVDVFEYFAQNIYVYYSSGYENIFFGSSNSLIKRRRHQNGSRIIFKIYGTPV